MRNRKGAQINGQCNRTYKVELPISYQMGTKISAKNNLWEEQAGKRENTSKIMRVQRNRDSGGNACIDHNHMSLKIPPKYSAAQIMGLLKGKSSLMLFERLQNLKQKFLNRTFRCNGYYVSTDGLNEETIRKNKRKQQDRGKATENKKTGLSSC